ncbi:MAG TPA: hypothetical protein EYH39_04065 [Desulfurobacteriaceae bacterium]|nr:hypothetical protein [Desulfurobacteriaceae bacterium]
MSGLLFIFLTFLTFYLIWSFYYGYKKNIKLAKDISKNLENLFRPKDTSYVWLGGAVGFRALYKPYEKDLKQILVNLRLQPRQSIFYYLIKFLFLRSLKDNIQILYFFKKPISFEFHAIKSFYNPKIFNQDLKKDKEENFKFLYSSFLSPKLYENLKKLSIKLLKESNIKHLAITPDRKVIYFEFDFNNLNDLKENLEISKKFLKEFLNLLKKSDS